MRTQRLQIWLAAMAAISLFASGCGKKAATSTVVSAAPAVVGTGPAPNEDDCRAFGKKLEAAIASGDRDTVNRLYRIDDLIARSVSDLGLPAKLQNALIARAKKDGGAPLADQIFDVVEKAGKFTFLRVRPVDSRLRVLMRIIHPEGEGVNYHDFTLARYSDGQVAAEDIHIMHNGEMLSQTVRRVLVALAAERDQGVLAKISGRERVCTKHLPRLQEMTQAARQGRDQQAMNAYRLLPTELQRDKSILLIALQAAAELSDEEYLSVMETFRAHYPNDGALDMVSIDYYTLKKDFRKALESVERLDKEVGGDAHLWGLRADLLLEDGRVAEAGAAAEKGIEQEPTLEGPYWSRITVALKEARYDETLVWLKRVVERCDVTIDEEFIKTNELYAPFAKSPQFTEFQKWYAERQK